MRRAQERCGSMRVTGSSWFIWNTFAFSFIKTLRFPAFSFLFLISHIPVWVKNILPVLNRLDSTDSFVFYPSFLSAVAKTAMSLRVKWKTSPQLPSTVKGFVDMCPSALVVLMGVCSHAEQAESFTVEPWTWTLHDLGLDASAMQRLCSSHIDHLCPWNLIKLSFQTSLRNVW